MQEAMDKRTGIETLEIIKIIKEVYSLPKLSKHERFRNEEVTDLKNKLRNIDKLFKHDEKEINYECDNFGFDAHIEELKRKLYEHLISLFPKLPIYLIIKNINQDSMSLDLEICEKLMHDMISLKREIAQKEEMIKITKNIFEKLDIKKSGSISKEDLEFSLSQKDFSFSQSVIDEFTENYEFIKNGKFSFDDFAAYSTRKIQQFYKLFFNLDFDQDLKLNSKQLQQTLHEIYPDVNFIEHFQIFFTMMNPDENGLISMEDWCKFLVFFPKENFVILVKYLNTSQEEAKTVDNLLVKYNEDEENEKIFIKNSKSIPIFIIGGFFAFFIKNLTNLKQKITIPKIFLHTSFNNFTKNPFKVFIQKKKQLTSLYLANNSNSTNFLLLFEKFIQFYSIEYYLNKTNQLIGDFRPLEIMKLGFFSSALSSLAVFPMKLIRFPNNYLNDIFKSTNSLPIKNNINRYKNIPNNLIPELLATIPRGGLNIFFYFTLKKYFIENENTNKKNFTKYFGMGAVSGFLTGLATYSFKNFTGIFSKKTAIKLLDKIDHKMNFKNTSIKMMFGQSICFGVYELTKLTLEKI